MPSSGPRYPGTAVSDASVGTVAWTTPGNATASDNARTRAQLPDTTAVPVSQLLKVTGFGFALAADVTVLGIVVEVERKPHNLEITINGRKHQVRVIDERVRIVKAGVVKAADRASADPWTATSQDDQIVAYGSPIDLWGEAWTPAEINDAGFGVAIAVTRWIEPGSTEALAADLRTLNADIDSIRITVHYTTRDGAYVGSVTLSQPSGVIDDSADRSVDFSTAGARADVPLGLVLLSTNYELTLEAWVFPTARPAAGVQDVIAESAEGALRVRQDENGQLLVAFTGTVWATGITLLLNASTHLVVRRSSDLDERVYINGVLAARRTAAAGGTVPGSATIHVGGKSGAGLDSFSGRIDEVAFYDYPLPDESIKLHYSAGQDPPAAAAAWQNVTAYARAISVGPRGRSGILDKVQAAPMNATLKNDDRRFEPANAASPYYPNVLPMRRIRFRATYGATTYALFRGHLDGFPQAWPSHRRSTTSVRCVDGFAVLAADELPLLSLPEQLTGARINAVLDAAGWPEADRLIDAGAETVLAATLNGEAPLAHLQQVADSELGVFFVNGAGQAVFHDRRHRTTAARSTASQATFGDGGAAELPYLPGLVADFDVTQVCNVIRMTRPGGIEQVAIDYLSRKRYWPRVLPRNVLLSTDTAVRSQAERLLELMREPRMRFATIRLEPARHEALWPVVLGLEISDRITIIRRPQGGTAITKDYFVEAVGHTLTENDWLADVAVSLA